MHFHLPKPLHGWREFAGEVGIIVIGVLIALGAEQVVEDWRWHQRIHDAEASMSRELGDDDGAQAYARLAVAPCIRQHLDAVEQSLIAERDKGMPFISPKVSTPPFRTWDNDAWRAAVSSGVTSHMTTGKAYDWSSPYALIGDMDQGAMREFTDWAELTRLATLPPHPSEAERQRIFAALAHARQDNEFLAWMSDKFIRYSQIVGVGVSGAAKRKQIGMHRALLGCA